MNGSDSRLFDLESVIDLTGEVDTKSRTSKLRKKSSSTSTSKTITPKRSTRATVASGEADDIIIIDGFYPTQGSTRSHYSSPITIPTKSTQVKKEINEFIPALSNNSNIFDHGLFDDDPNEFYDQFPSIPLREVSNKEYKGWSGKDRSTTTKKSTTKKSPSISTASSSFILSTQSASSFTTRSRSRTISTTKTTTTTTTSPLFQDLAKAPSIYQNDDETTASEGSDEEDCTQNEIDDPIDISSSSLGHSSRVLLNVMKSEDLLNVVHFLHFSKVISYARFHLFGKSDLTQLENQYPLFPLGLKLSSLSQKYYTCTIEEDDADSYANDHIRNTTFLLSTLIKPVNSYYQYGLRDQKKIIASTPNTTSYRSPIRHLSFSDSQNASTRSLIHSATFVGYFMNYLPHPTIHSELIKLRHTKLIALPNTQSTHREQQNTNYYEHDLNKITPLVYPQYAVIQEELRSASNTWFQDTNNIMFRHLFIKLGLLPDENQIFQYHPYWATAIQYYNYNCWLSGRQYYLPRYYNTTQGTFPRPMSVGPQLPPPLSSTPSTPSTPSISSTPSTPPSSSMTSTMSMMDEHTLSPSISSKSSKSKRAPTPPSINPSDSSLNSTSASLHEPKPIQHDTPPHIPKQFTFGLILRFYYIYAMRLYEYYRPKNRLEIVNFFKKYAPSCPQLNFTKPGAPRKQNKTPLLSSSTSFSRRLASIFSLPPIPQHLYPALQHFQHLSIKLTEATEFAPTRSDMPLNFHNIYTPRLPSHGFLSTPPLPSSSSSSSSSASSASSSSILKTTPYNPIIAPQPTPETSPIAPTDPLLFQIYTHDFLPIFNFIFLSMNKYLLYDTYFHYHSQKKHDDVSFVEQICNSYLYFQIFYVSSSHYNSLRSLFKAAYVSFIARRFKSIAFDLAANDEAWNINETPHRRPLHSLTPYGDDSFSNLGLENLHKRHDNGIQKKQEECLSQQQEQQQEQHLLPPPHKCANNVINNTLGAPYAFSHFLSGDFTIDNKYEATNTISFDSDQEYPSGQSLLASSRNVNVNANANANGGSLLQLQKIRTDRFEALLPSPETKPSLNNTGNYATLGVTGHSWASRSGQFNIRCNQLRKLQTVSGDEIKLLVRLLTDLEIDMRFINDCFLPKLRWEDWGAVYDSHESFDSPPPASLLFYGISMELEGHRGFLQTILIPALIYRLYVPHLTSSIKNPFARLPSGLDQQPHELYPIKSLVDLYEVKPVSKVAKQSQETQFTPVINQPIPHFSLPSYIQKALTKTRIEYEYQSSTISSTTPTLLTTKKTTTKTTATTTKTTTTSTPFSPSSSFTVDDISRLSNTNLMYNTTLTTSSFSPSSSFELNLDTISIDLLSHYHSPLIQHISKQPVPLISTPDIHVEKQFPILPERIITQNDHQDDWERFYPLSFKSSSLERFHQTFPKRIIRPFLPPPYMFHPDMGSPSTSNQRCRYMPSLSYAMNSELVLDINHQIDSLQQPYGLLLKFKKLHLLSNPLSTPTPISTSTPIKAATLSSFDPNFSISSLNNVPQTTTSTTSTTSTTRNFSDQSHTISSISHFHDDHYNLTDKNESNIYMKSQPRQFPTQLDPTIPFPQYTPDHKITIQDIMTSPQHFNPFYISYSIHQNECDKIFTQISLDLYYFLHHLFEWAEANISSFLPPIPTSDSQYDGLSPNMALFSTQTIHHFYDLYFLHQQRNPHGDDIWNPTVFQHHQGEEITKRDTQYLADEKKKSKIFHKHSEKPKSKLFLAKQSTASPDLPQSLHPRDLLFSDVPVPVPPSLHFPPNCHSTYTETFYSTKTGQLKGHPDNRTLLDSFNLTSTTQINGQTYRTFELFFAFVSSLHQKAAEAESFLRNNNDADSNIGFFIAAYFNRHRVDSTQQFFTQGLPVEKLSLVTGTNNTFLEDGEMGIPCDPLELTNTREALFRFLDVSKYDLNFNYSSPKSSTNPSFDNTFAFDVVQNHVCDYIFSLALINTFNRIFYILGDISCATSDNFFKVFHDVNHAREIEYNKQYDMYKARINGQMDVIRSLIRNPQQIYCTPVQFPPADFDAAIIQQSSAFTPTNPSFPEPNIPTIRNLKMNGPTTTNNFFCQYHNEQNVPLCEEQRGHIDDLPVHLIDLSSIPPPKYPKLFIYSPMHIDKLSHLNSFATPTTANLYDHYRPGCETYELKTLFKEMRSFVSTLIAKATIMSSTPPDESSKSKRYKIPISITDPEFQLLTDWYNIFHYKTSDDPDLPHNKSGPDEHTFSNDPKVLKDLLQSDDLADLVIPLYLSNVFKLDHCPRCLPQKSPNEPLKPHPCYGQYGLFMKQLKLSPIRLYGFISKYKFPKLYNLTRFHYLCGVPPTAIAKKMWTYQLNSDYVLSVETPGACSPNRTWFEANPLVYQLVLFDYYGELTSYSPDAPNRDYLYDLTSCLPSIGSKTSNQSVLAGFQTEQRLHITSSASFGTLSRSQFLGRPIRPHLSLDVDAEDYGACSRFLNHPSGITGENDRTCNQFEFYQYPDPHFDSFTYFPPQSSVEELFPHLDPIRYTCSSAADENNAQLQKSMNQDGFLTREPASRTPHPNEKTAAQLQNHMMKLDLQFIPKFPRCTYNVGILLKGELLPNAEVHVNYGALYSKKLNSLAMRSAPHKSLSLDGLKRFDTHNTIAKMALRATELKQNQFMMNDDDDDDEDDVGCFKPFQPVQPDQQSLYQINNIPPDPLGSEFDPQPFPTPLLFKTKKRTFPQSASTISTVKIKAEPFFYDNLL